MKEKDIAAFQTLPPGLENPATRGFNARSGDFMGRPIFSLSFDDGQHREYGPPSGTKKDYPIPDGMTFEPRSKSFSSNSTTYISSEAEYDQKMSASTKGQIKGFSYSGSVNSSIAFHGNMQLNSKYTYGLMFDLQQTYETNWFKLPALQQAFIDDINNLPASLATDSDMKAYSDFFDEYGTHYLKSGVFGGFMTMQNRIEEELFKTSTEKEISAGIEAGYDGLVAKGSMSAETAYSSSQFLSEHRKDIQIQTFTNGGIRQESLPEYFQTVFNDPILLLEAESRGGNDLVFPGIVNLFSVAGASQAIIATAWKAWESYLLKGFQEDGILGVPRYMGFNQEYQAVLGGFVNYNLSKTGNHQRAQVEAQEAASQNWIGDSQFLAGASIDYHKKDSGGRDTYIKQANLLLPVSTGYYYNSQKSPVVSEGSPNIEGAFMPFGIGGLPSLGSVEMRLSSMSPESSYSYKRVCETDGFMVVNLNSSEASDSGASFTASVQAPGSSDKNILNATSVYWHEGKHRANVPWQSICTPVRKNETYYGEFKQTQKNPNASFSMFWVPLNAPYAFTKAAEFRKTETIYQAETDGFLMVYLADATGDDRAETTVYWDEESGMPNAVALAQTSIQYHPDHETYIPYNSITIPIVRGRYYKVVTDTTKGKADTIIHWIPAAVDPYNV